MVFMSLSMVLDVFFRSNSIRDNVICLYTRFPHVLSLYNAPAQSGICAPIKMCHRTTLVHHDL